MFGRNLALNSIQDRLRLEHGRCIFLIFRSKYYHLGLILKSVPLHIHIILQFKSICTFGYAKQLFIISCIYKIRWQKTLFISASLYLTKNNLKINRFERQHKTTELTFPKINPSTILLFENPASKKRCRKYFCQ